MRRSIATKTAAEVANAAHAVANCIEQIRDGRKQPDDGLDTPRAK